MKNITLLICLLGLTSFYASGQSKKLYGLRWDGSHELFGTIDFTTGNFSSLDSLPGVRGIIQGMSSSDNVRGKFFFEGNDNAGESYLYTIEVKTGKIIQKTHLSSSSLLSEIEYDTRSNKFYGLQWYNSHEWFASVDTASDSITRLDTIAYCNGIAQGICGFDTLNNRYFFRGDSRTGVEYYYFLNAGNGHLINKIAVDSTHPLFLIHFDEIRKKLYGIGWDGAHEFIGTMDSLATVSEINTILGVNGSGQGISEYDATNGRFYFLGDKRDGTNYIYGIDVSSGSIETQTPNTTTNATLFHVYGLNASNASTLKGTVTTSTSAALKNSKVYLCTYDAADTIVNVIDSTITDSLGHYSFYTNDTAVYLFAMPNTSYTTQMPTWSDSALYFQDATAISIHSGTNTKDFSTLSGSNPGGTGFIGGKVVYCSICKMAAPVAGLRIILADKNGNPIAYTYTDKNGNFAFKKIAINDYKLLVDRPKIDNSKAPLLSLTSSASNLSNLSFTLFPNELSEDKTNGIENESVESNTLSVYPNPFNGDVNISYPLTNKTFINVSLTDMTGRSVYSFNSSQDAGIFRHSINGGQLGSGVYILRIINGNDIKTIKLVRE